MDLVLLFAFAGASLSGFIDVIWKRLRMAGVGTRGILAAFVFSIPLLMALLWFVSADLVLSSAYLWLLGAWVIGTIVSNYGMIYLYRYRGLSELNTYQLGISAFFGLLLDLFWYRGRLEGMMLLAVIALLIGGGLLSGKKERLSTVKVLLVLLVIAVFRTADYFLFKLGLAMQENILAHVAISQIVLFPIFFVLGATQYGKAVRDRTMQWTHIAWLSALIFVYNVGAAYVIDVLPLVASMLSTVVALCVYVVYDLHSKELRPSPSTAAAIVLILAGVALLSL